MKGYKVAIVGATGLVGQEFIKVLEQRNFPMASISLFASDRSAGKKMFVSHKELEVKETVHESFKGIDIALFSAGAEISRYFSPIAAQSGAVVIDNSAAFRMVPTVPLVVPEINPEDIKWHKGIIANPESTLVILLGFNIDDYDSLFKELRLKNEDWAIVICLVVHIRSPDPRRRHPHPRISHLSLYPGSRVPPSFATSLWNSPTRFFPKPEASRMDIVQRQSQRRSFGISVDHR